MTAWDLLLHSWLACTAILLLAGAGSIMLRRQSAALKHRLWTLSLLGTLAVPVLSALLPNVGPAWPTNLHASGSKLVRSMDPAGDSKFSRIENALGDSARHRLVGNDEAFEIETFVKQGRQASGPRQITSVVRKRWEPAAAYRGNQMTALADCFAMGWLSGVVIGLCVFGKRRMSAVNIVRRAVPVTSSHVLQLCRTVRESVGVRTSVPLLCSSEITVPVTVGWLRPVIVLPTGYGHWTIEFSRTVLAHELAHVQRVDLLSQLIAQLASILYWCQPLVWFANWRLRVEREYACDDTVVRMGASPREYANHLVDFAEALCHRPNPPADVVAMSSNSSLEKRVRAILHPCLNRDPVCRRTGRILAAGIAAIALSLGLLSPSASQEFASRSETADARKHPRRDDGNLMTVEKPLKEGIRKGHAAEIALVFPSDFALGVVYVQDQGKDIQLARERLAYAKGIVRVPAHKEVRLDVSVAARHDLSDLRRLPANGIQMLAIREADLDGEALENIRHLAGLKSVLLYCCRIDDSGMAQLGNLSSLETLDLSGSTFGDEGIAKLAPLESLAELNLANTTVDDRGLVHLAKLKSLKALHLTGTEVSDAGLALLRGVSSLEVLDLSSLRSISNAGLAHLANLTMLRQLNLSNSYSQLSNEPLGDPALEHLSNLVKLRSLALVGTTISDAGLIYLTKFSCLEDLRLSGIISDAGLERVAAIPSLRKLSLSGTTATDQGIAALTQLDKLEHLNLSCATEALVTDRAMSSLAQIEKLRSLNLRNTNVTDEGLATLAGLEFLEDLALRDNRISYQGLRHLEQFPSLSSLAFSGLQGSSGSLRHLQGLRQLKSLTVGSNLMLGVDAVGTDEGDEGLAYLAKLTQLESLRLSSVTVTDEGMRHLSELTSLREIHLVNEGNSISDAGLAHLAGMQNLESLFIRGSLTDRGLGHLIGLDSLRTTSVLGRTSKTISHEAFTSLSEKLPSLTLVYNLWNWRGRHLGPRGRQR